MDAEDGCAEVALIYDADLLDADLHTRLMSVQDCLQNAVSGDEAVSVNKVEPWNSVRITLNISREDACTLHQLAVQNSKILRDLGILTLSVENGQIVNLTDSKVASVSTKEICATPVNPSGNMTPVPRLSLEPAVLHELQAYDNNSAHRRNADVRNDFAQHWPPDGFSSRAPLLKHFGGETEGWSVSTHARREQFNFPVSKSETFGNCAAFHKISNRCSTYPEAISDCLPPPPPPPSDTRGQSSVSLTASHDNRLEAHSARRACCQDGGDQIYKNFESSFGQVVTLPATAAATAFNRSQNNIPTQVAGLSTEVNGWGLFDEQRSHCAGVTSRGAHLQMNWANAVYYRSAEDLGNGVFGPAKCGQEKPSGDDYFTNLRRGKIVFDKNKDLTVDFKRHRRCDPRILPTDRTERRCSFDVSPVDVDLGGRSYVPTVELCSSSDFSVFSPASLEEMWDSKESILCDQMHAAPLAESSKFAVERALTLLSENDEGTPHKTIGNSANVLESSLPSSLCRQNLEQTFDSQQNSLVKLRGMSSALERNMGNFRYGDRFSASCDGNSEHFFENPGQSKTFNDSKSCNFLENRWNAFAATANKTSACRSASFGSSESCIRADGRNYPRTYSDGGCAELQFSPLSRIQTPAALFNSSENPGYNSDIFSYPRRSTAAGFSQTPAKSCTVQRSRYSSLCNLPISATHDSLQSQPHKKSFYDGRQKLEPSTDCVLPGSSPRDNCAWNEFDLCGSIPDSGIASNTSSGGSDLSELERTLGSSVESFTRCQEMAEVRSRFRSGGTADDEVNTLEKRHGYLSKPLAQNNSSGVHVEPFFHKDTANSGSWHENPENYMSQTPTECSKGGFGRSRDSGDDQNKTDANGKVAEMPASVSNEHGVLPGSDLINSGQKVRVKLKVASHPSDVSPPKIIGSGCFEPSITCPNLPRRLSESIKLVMRGVPLVGTPSASVPAASASTGGGQTSDPAEDARPSTVIRITKTRSAHCSKQKETWSIQPVIRQSQNGAGASDAAASVAFSVHETAPEPSCVDIPPRPAKPTVHAKVSSKFARKVVIDVDGTAKRRKLTADALPFGTARCRLWQNSGTKGHKRNSNIGGQASCEKVQGGIRVETQPFCGILRNEFDAKGLEKRTREGVWRADVANKQRCGSHEKFS